MCVCVFAQLPLHIDLCTAHKCVHVACVQCMQCVYVCVCVCLVGFFLAACRRCVLLHMCVSVYRVFKSIFVHSV